MQSAVDRILSGNFNTGNHVLGFSEPVIELSVKEDTTFEGSFEIEGPEEAFTEGWVSSTNPRVNVEISEFSGSRATVPYSFDTHGLVAQDSFKGEFRIISNQGEYLLPYEVKIEADNLDASIGNIKNLFHFTNLARANYKEAVSLFHSPGFEKIFSGAQKQYLGVYRALKGAENKEQALEEFLLYVKKKQPTDYLIEEPNIRIDSVLGDQYKELVINRNGWGYSELNIECDAPFVSLSQTKLTNDDFDGNRARLSYTVHGNRLHDGRNFGSIHLRNAYNDICVTITVENHPINRKIANLNRSTKRYLCDLMRYYEAFRCKKISASSWMEETRKIIEELRSLEPDRLDFELFNVQLLITMEKYNEAAWTLEQLESQFEDITDTSLFCYYRYLFTLLNRNEARIEQITEEVRSIFLDDPGSWRIAWLLMYLSEDYARSPLKRWELLRDQFKMGAFSPVIFTEAYQILVNNPTLLSTLGRFEIQVLRYMAKKQILTPDVIEQLLYLFGRGRNYHKNMLGLLYECYRVLPNAEVLQAVCLCLINLERTDAEAFAWYAKAVEGQIRVTRLYEYYMESYDMSSGIEIPKMVLMYFSFDSALEPLRTSFLYAYVYRNKTKYPELFESYREAIERFVTSNLLSGNNNIYLAYLYKNLITRSMVTEDIAKGLSRVLFMHLLKLKRSGISKLYLIYENVTEKLEIPLMGQTELYLPLYGNSFWLVLEDNEGNRFTRDTEYSLERLMVPDILADTLPALVSEPIFDLWVCEKGKELQPINADNASAMKRLAYSDIIAPELQREIKARLIHYYYDADRLSELDELIGSIAPEEVEPGVTSDVIHFMVLRGMYEKAYEWIRLCGSDNIDAKVIMRLCVRLLKSEESSYAQQPDPTLTALGFRAFSQGKYDETLVEYLVKNFDGTCRELREIWKAATEYRLDTTRLELKLLEQQLETNAYVPGLLDIILRFDQRNLQPEVIIAILAQICFEYFVNDRVIEDGYLKLLESHIEKGENIPLSCKLAYTKYYSGVFKSVSESISRTVVSFLKDIIAQGMYFAYFKEYADDLTYMHRYLDQTIVEYRVKEGQKASIHYMIEKQGQSSEEYVREDMRDMYHGICVKQFVLFFGERLEYYIVEHENETEQLTLSDSYSHNAVAEHASDSKYNLINDIAVSRTLGDYGTMDTLLREYFWKEFLLGQMFEEDD